VADTSKVANPNFDIARPWLRSWITRSAVRSHDPFQIVFGNWLIRRLSPDSNPIEIDKLPKERDEYALLSAMGREAANVHLGTKNQVKRVLRDLSLKKPNWLRRAGKKMAKAVEKDWRKYS
jgi:hypothetical protein